MTDAIPIPGPLGLGDIIDRSVRIYRARFKPMLLTSTILLGPAALITGVMAALPFLTARSEQDAINALLTISSGTLTTLITAVVQGVLTVALAFHALAALRNQPLTAGEAIRSGVGRFLPWLGMTLLQMLSYAGVAVAGMLPFIVVTALLAGAGDDASIVAVLAAVCLFFLAAVLVFGPIAYLVTRWIASLPALVEEEAGPREALRRSWGLTKGRVWRSLGFVVVLTLLGMIVSSLPSLALTTVLMPVAAAGGVDVWMAVQTIGTALITFAVSAFWLPLSTSAYVLYYFDLRVRREGYDLEQRIAELEAETTAE